MRSETSPCADRDAGAYAGHAARAAHAAREVIELLEVLWNKGRDMTSSAPVSSSQLRVLYILERDQPINLRTLGDVLGSAPSSVSRMCDRLDALGFIERSPSAASRREVELRLSSRGESYLKDLRARREAALIDVISAMPAAQRRALATGLSGFRLAADRDAAAAGEVRTAGSGSGFQRFLNGAVQRDRLAQADEFDHFEHRRLGVGEA